MNSSVFTPQLDASPGTSFGSGIGSDSESSSFDRRDKDSLTPAIKFNIHLEELGELKDTANAAETEDEEHGDDIVNHYSSAKSRRENRE